MPSLRACISLAACALKDLTSSSTVPNLLATLSTLSVTSSILVLKALLSSFTSSDLASVYIILLIMACRVPMVKGSSDILLIRAE